MQLSSPEEAHATSTMGNPAPRRIPSTSSDPAVGACSCDCFVSVLGAEFGHRGGEVVANGAGGQCGVVGDVVDGGAAGGEFQDVAFPGGEWAGSVADGFGGELWVDVTAAVVHGADDVGEYLRGNCFGNEPA